MQWINKLERKFGKYAIKNLIVYILGAYAIGYVLHFMDRLGITPGIYSILAMDPEAICHGQVWRLVTWVCTVPQSPSLFLIFMFMFYFWIGRTLENVWGTFRYNLFIFMGLIMMTIAPMLIYLITGLIGGFDQAISLSSSTYYLNLTSFLAFAAIFPDQQVYFMFLIPVKMKWLAILDGVLLSWNVIQYIMLAVAAQSPATTVFAISGAVSILLSVANFLVFFLATRNYQKYSPKEVKRKRNYKKQVKASTAGHGGARHYCAICGRTELTNPELQFRFCSKCKGNLEYCSDHIFTHEHKK